MRITRIITTLFIGVLLILSACTKSLATTTPPQGANEIRVYEREFRPSVITVPVGTKVTWVSRDREDQHTVTNDIGLFDGLLVMLGSFSYTFTERGTFQYRCYTHGFEGMTGMVVVE